MRQNDAITGLFIADPEVIPFNSFPDYSTVKKASESLILSASGWRKIFAADNDEESRTERISSEDFIIAAIMALSFSTFIKKRVFNKDPLILLGMDSRFTGPAIADAMTRVFIAEGMQIRSHFIIAAPEIMAYSALEKEVDGFAYISASHNPVGHNGLKFGSRGGVFGGADSIELISIFRRLLELKDIVDTIEGILSRCSIVNYSRSIKSIPIWKKKAFDAYYYFARSVVADTNIESEIDIVFDRFRNASKKNGIGLFAELNGSARTLSIDKMIFESAGIKFTSLNNKPREIVHRIVPEGFSLDMCRDYLEKKHLSDSSYLLGYVPDNDGDRGNIVYIDTNTGKAQILEAQEVFALAVLSELAFLAFSTSINKKIAVAVNGPTSMRIDRIACFLGADVFRAEVGEANVVNLARLLREKGYTVRILGEGSNGGNITHPAAVRDPLNTVFSILKLLLFKELFKTWCERSGQDDKYRENYGIADVISSLPSFSTTSAYNPRAIMKIKTDNHALLKKRFEQIFLIDWEEHKEFLRKDFDIISFQEVNYESVEQKYGFGPSFRSGIQTGGLKILFSDQHGNETDYIWMRGSGTEPVFRVMADCKGNNPKREAWFLDWLRSMIERADK